MNGSEPNDHIEGVDLLFYRRTKPLHGHIVKDCYFPVKPEDSLFGTVPSPPPKTIPCIIETVPRSRAPVTLPQKPDKNHPTKGGTRKEPEPLFAEFARCNNIESMIHFADKYGRLTTGSVGLPDEADPIKIDMVPGEPIDLWQYEANLVLLAQTFWLADPEFTMKRIFFESDKSKDYYAVWYALKPDTDEETERRLLASTSDLHPQSLDYLNYLPDGDYNAASKLIAGLLVSSALNRHPARNNVVLKAVGKFELRAIPDNLISVIWHSLAEVTAEHRTIKRCIICGQLIEVHDVTSTMIFHKDCSNRTRMRRSRYKDIYTGLIAAGTPLPEVAKACKVNLQVLEYWLSLDNKQGGDKE